MEKPQRDEIIRYLNTLLANKSTDFISNEKKLERIVGAFEGLSYSDIRTIILNALKTVILSGRENLTNCDFIAFLLNHGVTHKEANESLGIPLRKIQTISKSLERKEP